MYKEIVDWYSLNKRELEFRKYNDPYAVWVSEIMAQQTKIDTMLPYFKNWMNKFPTINDCADARLDEIIKAWEGLGYYRRAKLLHQGCNHLKNHHNSIFPSDLDEILAIPGIGDYTASAISSIVFNQPNPAIDGNVIRIVSRVFSITEDSTKSVTKKIIFNAVKTWMYECNDCDYSSFTQGLMEIGALVCTPKSPKCTICPLNFQCSAYKNNNPEQFPIKPNKKSIPVLEYAVFIVKNNSKILVSKNWEDGLMEDLFRLPQVNLSDTKKYNNLNFLGKHNHIFSHKKWILSVYTVNHQSFQTNDSWVWIDFNQLRELPLITAHKRILEKYTDLL